jgi:hypothetical protein
MRFLATILFVFFVGCKPTKSDMNNHQNNGIPIINYEANARNFVLNIKVEHQMLFVSRVRDAKDYQEKITLSDADWKEIVTLTKAVDLVKVKELKGPTEKRFYDGAAHANITFVFEGIEYPANGFDHGYPPVEIEKLVNKIVKLTEK